MRSYLRAWALLIACGGMGFTFGARNQSEIDLHTRRAQEALAKHDLRTASEEYALVLKLDPGNAQVSAAQGMALYALGEPAAALEPLRRAAAAEATRESAETFLALSLADLGRCQEALPALREHFGASPDQKLQKLVGIAWLSCSGTESNTSEALDVARRLEESFPDDQDVLYQTAELYSALARRAVGRLLDKHPDSYRVHELAGEALESQNNEAQALIEYRKAVEINPKAPHVHYRIGNILLHGKSDASDRQALEEFKAELAVNNGDAPSEYQIAEILHRQNELAEAVEHYRKALALDPDFKEAHVGLAQMELAQGKANEAIGHLQTAVRLAPDDAGAHYSLMVAYRESGRADEAKREMELVEDLNARKRENFNQDLHTLLTGERRRQ